MSVLGSVQVAEGDDVRITFKWSRGADLSVRSPLAEFGFGAAAHVVPGHSTGLVCQSSARSPFEVGGPGSFNIGWTLCGRLVGWPTVRRQRPRAPRGEETGRHLTYPLDTPMANLFVSILNKGRGAHREARRQHRAARGLGGR
jgi:hypothetical protein